MGAEHYGEERAETAEALAELIIAEELKLGRWQEADLKTRPKGDSVKVALAARLRAETTMTVGWIAERLTMGTRGYLNHLLYRRRKLGKEETISRTDPFPTGWGLSTWAGACTILCWAGSHRRILWCRPRKTCRAITGTVTASTTR
jgi:hypothetical protein